VVGDLSFISLELVLDALTRVTVEDGDLALMVKPQFEVGRERVGEGEIRAEVRRTADLGASGERVGP
jgi:23S rRNA (cytidine1920-2'-O)/16S rRNA (cytidine1409-2'-O)-methyltransferase